MGTPGPERVEFASRVLRGRNGHPGAESEEWVSRGREQE